MKALKNISLLALIFSFNSMAVEMDAAPLEATGHQVEGKKPCPFKEAMKNMKTMYWTVFLAIAGADNPTIEKAVKLMEEMMKEEHVKYKELAMHFKAEAMKRLTDAGLSPEKAEEVLANYKEKFQDPLRKAIKAAMMEFAKKRMPTTSPGLVPIPGIPDAAPAQ